MGLTIRSLTPNSWRLIESVELWNVVSRQMYGCGAPLSWFWSKKSLIVLAASRPLQIGMWLPITMSWYVLWVLSNLLVTERMASVPSVTMSQFTLKVLQSSLSAKLLTTLSSTMRISASISAFYSRLTGSFKIAIAPEPYGNAVSSFASGIRPRNFGSWVAGCCK